MGCTSSLQMKLKKLFKKLRDCKKYKYEYRVKPSIKFSVDDTYYYFSLIPTITFMPWICRWPNIEGVVDIWWLNVHILIGTFEMKKESTDE